MSFAKSTTFLSSLILLLCFQTVLGDFKGFHDCLGFEKFAGTGKDPYAANLSELLGYLSDDTAPTGFCLGSKGEGQQDRAYGLALCRKDLSPANCSGCVHRATNDLVGLCPYNKAAAIWNNDCQLKYSNVNFFSQVDKTSWYFEKGIQNVSSPSSFDRNVTTLLSKLAEQAVQEQTMSAIGDMEIEGMSEKLQVLAQGTRDLSKAACKICLNRSISAIPACCSGKIEVRFYSATCDVRYGIASN